MDESELPETPPMHHREITLADGRYMIFFTFGDAEETAAPREETPENV